MSGEGDQLVYEYAGNKDPIKDAFEELITAASVEQGQNMCRSLYVRPELMNFKLYSMIKRGHNYNMPMGIQSNFLGKD